MRSLWVRAARSFGWSVCLLVSLASSQAAAETLQGRVTRVDKGPCPRGNCEWMGFDLVDDKGTRFDVNMQKMVIEGTVFVGHTVRVEGERDGPNKFKADRITDLVTSATVGYDSRTPVYPPDRRMTFEGTIDNLQPVEPPMPGQKRKVQKQRFVLSIPATRPSEKDMKISVERVEVIIRDRLQPTDSVVVTGRWTERNVLRADDITRK
jgi:hypothetical protein